jgi:hypothetical protein
MCRVTVKIQDTAKLVTRTYTVVSMTGTLSASTYRSVSSPWSRHANPSLDTAALGHGTFLVHDNQWQVLYFFRRGRSPRAHPFCVGLQFKV